MRRPTRSTERVVRFSAVRFSAVRSTAIRYIAHWFIAFGLVASVLIAAPGTLTAAPGAPPTPASVVPRPAAAMTPLLVVQQTAVDTVLARIDSLVEQNRLAEARSALEKWNAAHPSNHPDVASNDRAHAYTLRARLAQNWERAEEAWAAIALGYPVSTYAAEALLRLGQGLTTRAGTGQENAARRAVAYLERLIVDYPTTPFRAEGFLWLARALELDGRRSAACTRLDEARTIQTDSATSSLVRNEARRLCSNPTP